MLIMAPAAVSLAILKHQPNNIGGGVLTFYLIGTAWLTARRKHGETSRIDWIALLIPLATGVLGWMNGLDALRSPEGLTMESRLGCTFHGFCVFVGRVARVPGCVPALGVYRGLAVSPPQHG